MGLSAAGYAALAGAALNYANTTNTNHQRDEEAADAIRRQSLLQQKADAKVNQSVSKLAGDTSKDEADTRQAQYLKALRQRRAAVQNGLQPVIGSDTFREDAANAGQQASKYADTTADLMARMDAPTIQRRQEGFDYGNLGTDLSLLQRDSQGQAFIDRLRQQAIRRNAAMDLASGVLGGYASSHAGGLTSGDVQAMNAANYGPRTLATRGGYRINLPYGGN